MAQHKWATGDRVSAIYPNSQWGTGTIINTHYGETMAAPWGGTQLKKPVEVVRDGDGQIGYFTEDQVAPVSA